MVAVEERRVDLHARDFSAGYAEADHHPVEGGGVVPAGLPAVVPGARVHEDARARDGGGFGGEVCCFGEPLVAEGEDFGAERGGD